MTIDNEIRPVGFTFDFTPLHRFADRDNTNIVSWNEFDLRGFFRLGPPETVCRKV